jgi:hypothetical protein
MFVTTPCSGIVGWSFANDGEGSAVIWFDQYVFISDFDARNGPYGVLVNMAKPTHHMRCRWQRYATINPQWQEGGD